MTYIEFFDKDALENICTCLAMAPDCVILLGDKGQERLIKNQANSYKAFFAGRGKNIDFLFQPINKDNLQSIIDALSEIVEKHGDCVFDLTGGEDLCLVAMGIIFERCKKNGIQMHRFNISDNTVVDCDRDDNTISADGEMKLTVEENIRIYGGDIIYKDKENCTKKWDMTEDFKKDIDAIWNICKKDVGLWNTQVNVFDAAENVKNPTDNNLITTASVSSIINNLNRKFIAIKWLLNEIKNAGLITAFNCDDKTFSIAYKNEQVKNCLTKAGQALEMKIYKAALEAFEEDGALTYNDVMTGVYIDWDGDIHAHDDGFDTVNEIDVMMMHGLVPVFVSCKNGSVDDDELYKLDTVADMFGGKYAKKVLVATALGSDEYSEYLRQRAKDMGVRLVENIQNLSDSELNKTVRSFLSD